jgi:hypothetical protein
LAFVTRGVDVESNQKQERDIRGRVLAVLQGTQPERLPFIDRLELWFASQIRAGTLPGEFMTDSPSPMVSSVLVSLPTDSQAMPLPEVHRRVGMGQQLMMMAHARRLCRCELVIDLEGETVYRETDPVIDFFPRMYDILPLDRPGETVVQIITPVGSLTIKNNLTPAMVAASAVPLMREHPVKDATDARVLEYIVEHSEYVSKHEDVYEQQGKMGDIGFVVPLLSRVPFQQIVLDFVGEIDLFYMLYDNPQLVDRMMAFLDTQLMEDFRRLADLSWPYVQCPDNTDGVITNPKLFEKYNLPYYQKYAEILHEQGKKFGSHTDGNLRSLLGLLGESGLDVCEAFSPAPLTECTFEEAWSAWKGGPIIWGGIPSPILQEQTSETEFKSYVEHLLQTVGEHRIILGVGDMVMADNLIERVRYIADRVEQHKI